ncbi:Transcriptional regulator, TetR family [Burkholderiales bacterium 8X]|nr:Transcriptional regulator, TetR family [Burkholderiales bacterium 8X]
MPSPSVPPPIDDPVADASDEVTAGGRGRSRKYAQTLAQIYQAAVEVFAADGPIGATTQAIAERAGLSKSQLHYYIESKEALYRQVLQDIIDDWINVFGYADEALEPRKVLSDYIRRKMMFSFEHPQRSRIFAAEMMRGGPVAHALMGTSSRRTEQAAAVIGSWVQRGEMAPVDPLVFLFHLWATTQFYADQAEQVRLFKPGALDGDEQRERLLREVTQQMLRAAGIE